MRRRRTARTPAKTPGETPETAPGETSEEEVGGNLFDSSGDDARVLVWRRDDSTKKMVFVFALAPEEANELTIQQMRGGGYYLCKEQVRGEGGRMVFNRQRTVVIDGPPKEMKDVPRTPEERIAQGATAGLATTAASGERVSVNDIMSAGILQLFQANRETQQAQLEAMRAMNERRGPDWAAVLTAVTPLLAPLLTAMVSKDKDVDPLDIIEKVTSLVKSNTSPASSMREQLEVLNEILDVKQKHADLNGDVPDDPVMKVIQETAPRLIALMEQHQSGKGGAASAQAQSQRQLPTNIPAWQRAIAPYAKYLLGFAQQGKDPGTAAAFAYDMAPGTARAAVRELLVSDGPVEQVIAFIPPMSEHHGWVTEFLLGLADQFGLTEDETNLEPPEEEVGGPLAIDADQREREKGKK